MRKRTLQSLIIPSLIALLVFSLTPTQAAPQAAATGASLEVSSSSYLIGSPVTIRVYDVLAAGASFGVYFTYDSSGTDTIEAKTEFANISVQLGTGQDEWTYTMIWPAPTSGASITVHVGPTCGDGTDEDLASQQVMAQDPEDLLPTDMVITVGIALMIILIVVSIVMGLARRRR